MDSLLQTNLSLPIKGRTLDHIGLFTKKDVAPKPADLPRLTDPRDAQAPLDKRARSYLHANCAHCHMKWGGGNALFQLTHTLPESSCHTSSFGGRSMASVGNCAMAAVPTCGLP